MMLRLWSLSKNINKYRVYASILYLFNSFFLISSAYAQSKPEVEFRNLNFEKIDEYYSKLSDPSDNDKYEYELYKAKESAFKGSYNKAILHLDQILSNCDNCKEYKAASILKLRYLITTKQFKKAHKFGRKAIKQSEDKAHLATLQFQMAYLEQYYSTETGKYLIDITNAHYLNLAIANSKTALGEGTHDLKILPDFPYLFSTDTTVKLHFDTLITIAQENQHKHFLRFATFQKLMFQRSEFIEISSFELLRKFKDITRKSSPLKSLVSGVSKKYAEQTSNIYNLDSLQNKIIQTSSSLDAMFDTSLVDRTQLFNYKFWNTAMDLKVAINSYQLFNSAAEAFSGLRDILYADDPDSAGMNALLVLLGVSRESIEKLKKVEDELRNDLKQSIERCNEFIEFGLDFKKICEQKDYQLGLNNSLLTTVSSYLLNREINEGAVGEKLNAERSSAFSQSIKDLYNVDDTLDELIALQSETKDKLFYITTFNSYRRDLASRLVEQQYNNTSFSYLSPKISKEKLNKPVIDAFYFFEKSKSYLLVNKMDSSQTSFFNMGDDEKSLMLTSLMEGLTPQEAILNYLYIDNNLSVFLITKEYIKVKKLKLNKRSKGSEKTINEKIQAFNSSIYYQSDELYADMAFDLFKTLVPRINRDVTSLMIVTDEYLSQIPFEAFLTKKVKDKEKAVYENYNFLINEFDISYTYSLTLNHLLKEKNYDNSFLGIAPVAGEDLSFIASQSRAIDSLTRNSILTALPATKTEIESIGSYFDNTTLLLNHEATKQNIYEKVTGKKFVHFATHGFVNPDNVDVSGLIVYTENDSSKFLTAAEISKSKIDAYQVTLSACETGLGKVYKGEGVYGLSRSFIESGAQNLLVSLWKVDDRSTSTFMKDYYSNMQINNYSNVNALTKAKRKFIKSSSYSKPFYWAPFVLIRNKY